jgi:magnesium chelatase family protein
MTSKMLTEYGRPDREGLEMLRTAMDRFNMSARAYDRILKVARTIADLDKSSEVKSRHIAEAISYRNLDRSNWGQTYRG